MKCLVALFLLAPLALGQRPALPASPPPVPAKAETFGRWRVVFEHDKDNESLVITDFQFPSARRGMACGYLEGEGRKPRPVIILTSNGGQTWEIQPVKSAPGSMFFLDDSTGWMVTRDGLYQTLESGRSWRKVKTPQGIVRVFFLTPDRGWAFGVQKSFYETSDGGKTWTAVPAAAEPSGKPENSVYLWMAFASPKAGMLVGVSRPPRRVTNDLPPWLDPESAQGRPEWPASTLFLDTKDGGQHWSPSAASLFGTITRLRLNPSGGLALFEFRDRFDFPSEVVKLDVATGKSQSCFRRRDRAITDMSLGSDGVAYLAGFEPQGKLNVLPIPGKVKILRSDQPDRALWAEMPVDYRAVARRVFLASPTPGQVWAATDTGMILRLIPPK